VPTAQPWIGYLQRTEWNVRDSDGTVVFSLNIAGPRKSKEPGIAEFVFRILDQVFVEP